MDEEIKVDGMPREEFEAYCQWYDDTAEFHRQELEKMRGDLNLFAWFRGKK